MLIEDDRECRESLALGLKAGGHEVAAFEDPLRALEAFAGEDHALVLTDLRMPGLDGLQVLRRARKLKPQVPVVILTAYADLDNTVEALNLGAFAFFCKPVNLRSLLEKVEEAGRWGREHWLRRSDPRLED